MADVTPVFDPGDAITMTASAAVVGGQLVTLTGDRRVGPCGAGGTAIGVALRDAAAEAETVVQRNGVHRLTAAAAIAAGDRLIPAAAGQVTPVAAAGATAADIENSRDIIGIAFEAFASGAEGLVAVNLT